MPSKIGGVDGSSPSVAIGAGRAVQPGTSGTQNPAGSGGNGENVQITGPARQLATLEQALRELPAVNDARVAQISSAIEQGTYSVNSRHVADQLIQMEKALEGVADGSHADSEAAAD